MTLYYINDVIFIQMIYHVTGSICLQKYKILGSSDTEQKVERSMNIIE
jgi:hypothetical protein